MASSSMYGSNNAVERRPSNTSTRPRKPNGTEGTGPGQGSTISARRLVDTDTYSSVPQLPRVWQKRKAQPAVTWQGQDEGAVTP